ncbi:MAG: hypothetical protein R6X27_01940, partial [Candidatus Desulfacyla sp.]
DPAAMDAQIAEIKTSMAATTAGELPDGAPEELQTLTDTIARFVQLVDRGVRFLKSRHSPDMTLSDMDIAPKRRKTRKKRRFQSAIGGVTNA